MRQEEKQLLLKDLCARLPYGVIILHEGWNWEWDQELSTRQRVVGIDEDFIYTKVIDTHTGEEYRDDKWPIDLFEDKQYLRPMSSMTEEELKELNVIFDNCDTEYRVEAQDWLNEHHFDYRGLIEKGLAIEAKEGMYKTE